MSGNDTHGNPLLPGLERNFFGNRYEWSGPPQGHFKSKITGKKDTGYTTNSDTDGGSRRRRVRPSRKYKKSAKRVFRKKSRSTRRR